MKVINRYRVGIKVEDGDGGVHCIYHTVLASSPSEARRAAAQYVAWRRERSECHTFEDGKICVYTGIWETSPVSELSPLLVTEEIARDLLVEPAEKEDYTLGERAA